MYDKLKDLDKGDYTGTVKKCGIHKCINDSNGHRYNLRFGGELNICDECHKKIQERD